MGHVSEHVRDLLAARRFIERLAAHYEFPGLCQMALVRIP